MNNNLDNNMNLNEVNKEEDKEFEEDLENNDFVLIINKGPVTSVEKKEIYIEITDNNNKILLNGTSYDIDKNTVDYIKDYVKNNINKLVKYSMLENNQYLQNNALFGGSECLFVKFGLLTLSLNAIGNDEIINYYNSFTKEIKNIITNYKI